MYGTVEYSLFYKVKFIVLSFSVIIMTLVFLTFQYDFHTKSLQDNLFALLSFGVINITAVLITVYICKFKVTYSSTDENITVYSLFRRCKIILLDNIISYRFFMTNFLIIRTAETKIIIIDECEGLWDFRKFLAKYC